MCSAPVDMQVIHFNQTIVNEIPRREWDKINALRIRNDPESVNELVELLCKYSVREDDSFERLEQDPQPSVRSLRNLGWIRSNQRRMDEAIEYFRRAVANINNQKPDLRYDVFCRLAIDLELLGHESVIRRLEAITFYAKAFQRSLATERQFVKPVASNEIVHRIQALLINLPQNMPPNQHQMFVQFALEAGESLLFADLSQMAQPLFELCLRLVDNGPNRFKTLMNLFKCHKHLGKPFFGLSSLAIILTEDGRTDHERQQAATHAINMLKEELQKTDPYEIVNEESIQTLASILIKLAPFSFDPITCGGLPPIIPRRFCERVCDVLYNLAKRELDDLKLKACFQQLLWIANTYPDMNMIRNIEWLCANIREDKFYVIQEAFLSFARIQLVDPMYLNYTGSRKKGPLRSDVRFSSFDIALQFARVAELYNQQHDAISELHCLRVAILAGWSDERLSQNRGGIPRWWERLIECYNDIGAENVEAQAICNAFNQSLRSRGIVG